ncbi:hypothetical protein DW974_08735 [Lachnospiraceae bacterium AM48-27BH]|nr:hypothetical protein DW974_08735 [Lachnospiraceae bacterium AM48-27BH]
MLAKGRSQADRMTVGHALARGKTQRYVSSQKTRAKYRRFSTVLLVMHVRLTPTVLAMRQYNSLNYNVGASGIPGQSGP